MPNVLYQPDREDFLAACRLHHLSIVAGRTAAAFVLAYAGLIYGIVRFADGPVDVALALTGAGAALVLAMLSLAQLVRPRLIARRQFAEQRSLRDAHTLAWGDEGYAVRGPTVSSDLPWSHYVRWREDARVILLYPSRYAYQVVPKRVLPAGAVEFIRARLSAAGVPRSRRLLA